MTLFIAAGYTPLTIAAANPSGIPHPQRLIALAVLVWMAFTGLTYILLRLGVSRGPLVRTMFLAVLLFMGGGSLTRRLGTGVAIVVILLAISLAGLSFSRLRGNVLADALLFALMVALISGPLLNAYRGRDSLLSKEIESADALEVEVTGDPDIFVVVADGYPGAMALERDFEPTDLGLRDLLAPRGFEMPRSAWTPYWITDLAIPAVLDMDYPELDLFERSERARMYQTIGGANTLVATLELNGYETYMIESGWSGSDCSEDHFDICVPSPVLDEGVFKVLERSVMAPLVLEQTGGPFVGAATETMEWLLTNAAEISRSSSPQFVFAHLVVPHPPFYLARGCDLVVAPARSGVNFFRRGVSMADRESYFVDQAQCVGSFMARLADIVGEDDILVFLGDHGTDRRAQLTTPGDDWSSHAVVERMNVLVALRTPGRCAVGDFLVTVNLFRRILDCHSPATIEDVRNRMWINDMVEIEPPVSRRSVSDSGPPSG